MNIGTKAVRRTKTCIFMGTIVGAFQRKNGDKFLVMETYSGCVHFGPMDEFVIDEHNTEFWVEEALSNKMIVVYDRTNEPAEKVLPKITYGEGKY